MSSVLVTGGTGVIGSWVTRKLIEQGEKVVIYSRHPDTTLIKDILNRVDSVEGDILDLPNLIQVIRTNSVDRIVHMSTALIDPLEVNPFMGYRINVDGTMNVLEASRLLDVKRVVYTSSMAVYNLPPHGEYAYPSCKPIDEDYPKAPPIVYGATKLFMENMGLSYHRIYGLDFIALRFSNSFGPLRQIRHGILALHSKIIESAMLEKPFKVFQDVDQLNEIMYVRDMANAIVLACFAENLEHRIFNVGTGSGETLRHFIEIVDRIYGGARIEITPSWEAEKDIWACIFNIDRAREELGYAPQYDLEAGIGDYIETMKRLAIKPTVLS